MADAPWRCSQCGTVNAPSANACRTCGRWPSLFDLQSGAVDDEAPPDRELTETRPEAPEAWLPDEPEVIDEPTMEEASTGRDAVAGESAQAGAGSAPAAAGGNEKRASWPGPEPSIPSGQSGRRMRRLTRLALPILLVVYFLIRAVTNH